MSNPRAYELAKQLQIPTRTLIDHAAIGGVKIKSASSRLDINPDNQILWNTIANRAVYAHLYANRVIL